jgi:protein-S-isoprenylcysteine O-methyltransferase Ste14
MKPVFRTDRHEFRSRGRATAALAFLTLAICLLLAILPVAAADSGRETTFEDRAAEEKATRSSYRKLEVASLVIIFAAGAGVAYWAVRRRKP